MRYTSVLIRLPHTIMNWPARTWSVSIDLALPRLAVWDVLADTERLNRLIGLAVADFAAMDSNSGAKRDARTRIAGVPVRWRESPFQWEKGRHYTVQREYSSGPMAYFIGGVGLEDYSGGTRARLFADVTPANWAGKAILAKAVPLNLEKTAALLRDFILHGEAALQGNARPTFNQAALQSGLRELEENNARPVRIGQLRDFLAQRADAEVATIRPHLLAREWKAPVLEVTRLCLHAVRAGLLNLQWAVLCPNCRVAKADYSNLENLQSAVHCDVCGIDYKTQFDRFVELRFSVHPEVRRAQSKVYCIGGPAITPHVWTQKIMADGETVALAMPEIEGKLRLRVLRSNAIVVLRENSVGDANELVLDSTGWNREWVSRPSVGQKLLVTNRSGGEAVLALEEQDWNSEAITAAQVTSLQEFRDLFATEVMAPGHEVGIEQLTFFFSDLLESTDLYEREGDVAAYGRVRRHFDVLRHHIAIHNGAVVKTIGDSVMAVFYSPADAVRASLAIQRVAENAFATGDGFLLRIGLHQGGAIAVNADGNLDYFGRSVNIAARVETASRGGDVVLSEPIWSRPEVRRVLAESASSVEPFEANLKGIAQRIQLYRVAAAPVVEELQPARDDRRQGDRRALQI